MADAGFYWSTGLTKGGANGVAVSEDTELAPITSGILNATANQESSPISVGFRCDAGFNTSGNTTFALSGTGSTLVAIAPDNAGAAGTFGAYGAAHVHASTVTTGNTIIWIKFKAVSGETPANVITTNLTWNATVVPL